MSFAFTRPCWTSGEQISNTVSTSIRSLLRQAASDKWGISTTRAVRSRKRFMRLPSTKLYQLANDALPFFGNMNSVRKGCQHFCCSRPDWLFIVSDFVTKFVVNFYSLIHCPLSTLRIPFSDIQLLLLGTHRKLVMLGVQICALFLCSFDIRPAG